MRDVFVDPDSARVGFYKSVLDEAGIPNFIRNDLSGNARADPSPLFFPTLCVVNDEEYERAMALLGEIYDAAPTLAADWRCPKCGEEVPGNFDSCWQCGATRRG